MRLTNTLTKILSYKTLIPMLLITVFCVGCAKKTENIEELKINKDFKNAFIVKKVIKLNMNVKNGTTKRIFDVKKLMKFKKNKFLILDEYQTQLLLLNSDGSIGKIVANKGNGPGEFNSIIDFTIDDKNNIYVLDFAKLSVGMFDEEANYIMNKRLSFVHRNPMNIEYTKGSFIIGAHRNLTINSKPDDYTFLDYDQMCFINKYSKNFKLEKSFYHPCEKLAFTKGFFLLPNKKLTPFTFHKGEIYTLTQEGFYILRQFNINGELLKTIRIKSNDFKEININTLADFKTIKKASTYETNYPLEKLGAFVSGHSTPTNIFSTNKYLLIEICDPYENYYPMFSSKLSKNYHYDLFNIENEKPKPIESIKGMAHYSLIGVDKEKNDFFFSFESGGDSLINSIIEVEPKL